MTEGGRRPQGARGGKPLVSTSLQVQRVDVWLTGLPCHVPCGSGLLARQKFALMGSIPIALEVVAQGAVSAVDGLFETSWAAGALLLMRLYLSEERRSVGLAPLIVQIIG